MEPALPVAMVVGAALPAVVVAAEAEVAAVGAVDGAAEGAADAFAEPAPAGAFFPACAKAARGAKTMAPTKNQGVHRSNERRADDDDDGDVRDMSKAPFR